MRDFSVPDCLDDVPPPQAADMERSRARALALLAARDYQLVIPPLVEYLETLTAGDRALDLQTFKFTDTLSGRTLGVRADQTPQIARHDRAAAANGARRHCYCGPVLRARPPRPWQSRESMQLGAELFGAPSPTGDWEIIRVALDALAAAGLSSPRLDLGHAALFSRLTKGVSAETRKTLMESVVRRDVAAIQAVSVAGAAPAEMTECMRTLAQAVGDIAVIADAAKKLPPETTAEPLAELAYVARQLAAGGDDVGVSLSDLGSYGYHTGIVFAIYDDKRVIARGGRYCHREGEDGVGFSADLRLLTAKSEQPALAVAVPVVGDDPAWRAAVAALSADNRRIRFVHSEKPPSPPCLRRQSNAWTLIE